MLNTKHISKKTRTNINFFEYNTTQKLIFMYPGITVLAIERVKHFDCMTSKNFFTVLDFSFFYSILPKNERN